MASFPSALADIPGIDMESVHLLETLSEDGRAAHGILVAQINGVRKFVGYEADAKDPDKALVFHDASDKEKPVGLMADVIALLRGHTLKEHRFNPGAMNYPYELSKQNVEQCIEQLRRQYPNLPDWRVMFERRKAFFKSDKTELQAALAQIDELQGKLDAAEALLVAANEAATDDKVVEDNGVSTRKLHDLEAELAGMASKLEEVQQARQEKDGELAELYRQLAHTAIGLEATKTTQGDLEDGTHVHEEEEDATTCSTGLHATTTHRDTDIHTMPDQSTPSLAALGGGVQAEAGLRRARHATRAAKTNFFEDVMPDMTFIHSSPSNTLTNRFSELQALKQINKRRLSLDSLVAREREAREYDLFKQAEIEVLQHQVKQLEAQLCAFQLAEKRRKEELALLREQAGKKAEEFQQSYSKLNSFDEPPSDDLEDLDNLLHGSPHLRRTVSILKHDNDEHERDKAKKAREIEILKSDLQQAEESLRQTQCMLSDKEKEHQNVKQLLEAAKAGVEAERKRREALERMVEEQFNAYGRERDQQQHKAVQAERTKVQALQGMVMNLEKDKQQKQQQHTDDKAQLQAAHEARLHVRDAHIKQLELQAALHDNSRAPTAFQSAYKEILDKLQADLHVWTKIATDNKLAASEWLAYEQHLEYLQGLRQRRKGEGVTEDEQLAAWAELLSFVDSAWIVQRDLAEGGTPAPEAGSSSTTKGPAAQHHRAGAAQAPAASTSQGAGAGTQAAVGQATLDNLIQQLAEAQRARAEAESKAAQQPEDGAAQLAAMAQELAAVKLARAQAEAKAAQQEATAAQLKEELLNTQSTHTAEMAARYQEVMEARDLLQYERAEHAHQVVVLTTQNTEVLQAAARDLLLPWMTALNIRILGPREDVG